MRPDDPQMKNNSLFIPQRPSSVASSSLGTNSTGQRALADLTRAQINAIYQNDQSMTMPALEAKQPEDEVTPIAPQAAPAENVSVESQNAVIAQSSATEQTTTNPYMRVHDDEKATEKLSSDWQHYHSAWQNYYQQYFQRYYAGHLQQTQSALAEQTARAEALSAKSDELTPEEAADNIRSQLRATIKKRATAVKKSRHYYPILAASLVMLVFLFMQYNRVLFAYVAAYTSPGTTMPDNIIVDPTSTVAVNDEPRLIIPKINVDVPAVYDNTMGKTNKETYDLQMAAMAKGVAWFGVPKANSHPGQIGNTVLSGHSSSEWFDTGEYKFIFARLESLTIDDTIYANYKGVRYAYKVTKKEVVAPTNVKALQYDTSKPVLTLITCVPLGTANSRLLVTAEQISPDPATAKPAPANSSTGNTAIPGQSSGFIERITGN